MAEKGGSLLNILLGLERSPRHHQHPEQVLPALRRGAAEDPAQLRWRRMILATIAKQLSGKALSPSRPFRASSPSRSPTSPPPCPRDFRWQLSRVSRPRTTVPRPVASTAPAEGSGLPGWLLPLVGLGLLGCAGLVLLRQASPPTSSLSPKPRSRLKPAPAVVNKEELQARARARSAQGRSVPFPIPTKLGTDLTGVYHLAHRHSGWRQGRSHG